MKLFLRAFRYQWLILAAIFVGAGFCLPTLDIAVHDTYIVIDGRHIGILLGLLFAIMGSLYLIPVFRTSAVLSRIHLAGNSMTGILTMIGLFRSGIHETPRTYSDYSVYDEFNNTAGWMSDPKRIALLIIVFFVLQIIWIVQPLLFLIRKKTNAG